LPAAFAASGLRAIALAIAAGSSSRGAIGPMMP
jgi:hypothetical protein